jgi:hypothetical protein
MKDLENQGMSNMHGFGVGWWAVVTVAGIVMVGLPIAEITRNEAQNVPLLVIAAALGLVIAGAGVTALTAQPGDRDLLLHPTSPRRSAPAAAGAASSRTQPRFPSTSPAWPAPTTDGPSKSRPSKTPRRSSAWAMRNWPAWPAPASPRSPWPSSGRSRTSTGQWLPAIRGPRPAA